MTNIWVRAGQDTSRCNTMTVTFGTVAGANFMRVDRQERPPLPRTTQPHTVFSLQPLRASWWSDSNVDCHHSYQFTVSLYADQRGQELVGRGTTGGWASLPDISWCCTQSGGGSMILEERLGILQLMPPLGAFINQYVHGDTAILDGQWQHINTLQPPDGDTQGQALSVCIFQNYSGMLDAIVRERSSHGGSDFLVGYEFNEDTTLRVGEVEEAVEVEKEVKMEAAIERDTESREEEVEIEIKVEEKVEIEAKESFELRQDDSKQDTGWMGPVRLVANTGPIDDVTGPVAFIQSNYNKDRLFHLLVPRGAVIEQYTHSRGSMLDEQWTHTATLKPPSDATGIQFTAVSFAQTTQRKFAAIARVTPPQDADNFLVGYEFDSFAVHESHPASIEEFYPNDDWTPPFKLTTDTGPIDRVTGTSTIIESDIEGEKRFDLLVPRGATVDHYTHESGSIREGQWKHFATLKPLPGNTDLQFTAAWLVQNQVGGLEAATRVKRPQGDEFVVGYEFTETTGWSDGVALNANDGPILAGEPPMHPTQEPPTKPIKKPPANPTEEPPTDVVS